MEPPLSKKAPPFHLNCTDCPKPRPHGAWPKTARTCWSKPGGAGYCDRILDMFRQPMFALLVVAALLYMLLGDLAEGAIMAVFVLAVLGLTFFQEGRPKHRSRPCGN